jgi:hypothetical protein
MDLCGARDHRQLLIGELVEELDVLEKVDVHHQGIVGEVSDTGRDSGGLPWEGVRR